MTAWYARETLRCPQCNYDVGQTLADGFRVCPECGLSIDRDTCSRDIAYISKQARVTIYSLWTLPVILCWVTSMDLRLLASAWAISVAMVYGTWVWIERWLQPESAWARAAAPALAVLLVEVVLSVAALALWAAVSSGVL